MSADRLRARWAAGQSAVDCWLAGSSVLTAESIGRMGFDSVLIDMQHTMAEFRDVVGCLMAVTGSGTTALVRVPWNEPAMIQRVLDAGADGVMCPMVNTPEQAAAFVGAARFPPLGYRSAGVFRPGTDPLTYFRQANESLVTFAQIETVEAMDNLDAIAATPGLDALFVGPTDLSISYGGEPVMDYADPVVAQRHRRIVEAAHAAGKKAGMLALNAGDPELAAEWGMDFISVGMELMLVQQGARRVLELGRQVTGTHEAAAAPAPPPGSVS
jgi:4-hydroxy-2-oxoheptanedioate aldolase